MHKNAFIFSAIVVLGIGIAISDNNGPGGDYTGAPLSSGSAGPTCAVSGCHTSNADLGGSISINVVEKGQTTPMATFENNKIYTIQISIRASNSTKRGFEANVLNPSHSSVGNITNASSGAKIRTYSGRVCAEHSTPSSVGNWTFDWTSPATGSPDSVVIYAAGNASNSSNTSLGDDIKTTSKVLKLNRAASIPAIAIEPEFYPNPTNDKLHLSHIADEANIYNISGKRILELQRVSEIDVCNLEDGFYLIELQFNGQISVQKFQKL